MTNSKEFKVETSSNCWEWNFDVKKPKGKMAVNITGRGLDPRQDISMKLERSHLVYLQTDESPLKLEKRQKLEGIIKEYLHLVPHENKYVFPETAHILHRSAATINDFSGYRACSAWTAISLYASNLLAQPWRKEYRTLRTYSGYYKHEIEANLVGAELMFELMGYKHTGLGVLTLDGPIDPDRVSNVSRDAIVAFVECQIMKQIWEKVSTTFTVSWLQVLEFRESNVGSPDQAIRALIHRFWERLHQNRTKIENYRDFHYAQPAVINTIPSITMPYHVIPNNCKTAIAADVDYGYMDEMNLRYFRPVESSNRCNSYGFMPQQNNIFHGTPMHSDPYFINNSTGYVSRVQPDRLIELDTAPTPVINYEKSSSRHRRGSTQNKHCDDTDYSRLSRNIDDDYSKVERKNIKTSTSLDSAPHQTWDFVYRSLENIGYSKDIGEREDILRKKDNSRSKSLKTNQREHNDKYTNDYHQIRSGKSRESRGEIIGNTITVNGSELLKKKSFGDSLDLNITNDYVDIESSNGHQDKVKKINQSSANQPKNYQKVVGSMKNISIKPKDEAMKKNNRWSCSTCTYLNESNIDICDMCGKSKHKGNEDAPLASGGKECPTCTLVNERDASQCAACLTSLKDSPTYI
ncbi:hypothetical protein PV325_011851 [Microctonus aethiopoides]|nr:hypothetical protein PV325_011851 [Microctonus aethiopoides]